jgi:hypothetical protein
MPIFMSADVAARLAPLSNGRSIVRHHLRSGHGAVRGAFGLPFDAAQPSKRDAQPRAVRPITTQ